ncbi:MAG TPA: hypothetical protein VFH61_06870, partial [Thermoleophilia bacterium]|nr:hypothetical protein [Thermoleophilia bacterium]
MRIFIVLSLAFLLVACADDDGGPLTGVDLSTFEDGPFGTGPPIQYGGNAAPDGWSMFVSHQFSPGFTDAEQLAGNVYAHHGPNCEAPGEDGSTTHFNDRVQGAVFSCA